MVLSVSLTDVPFPAMHLGKTPLRELWCLACTTACSPRRSSSAVVLRT